MSSAAQWSYVGFTLCVCLFIQQTYCSLCSMYIIKYLWRNYYNLFWGYIYADTQSGIRQNSILIHSPRRPNCVYCLLKHIFSNNTSYVHTLYVHVYMNKLVSQHIRLGLKVLISNYNKVIRFMLYLTCHYVFLPD